MNKIVVGVDGSPGSVAAFEFALDEASARQAEVKVVSAWHVPSMVYGAGYVPDSALPEDFEAMAKESLDSVLEQVNGAKRGIPVTSVLREGSAADVLVEESRDADLLVVGSRGRGAIKGLLLGSVSQRVADHATCPVTIIPNARP